MTDHSYSSDVLPLRDTGDTGAGRLETSRAPLIRTIAYGALAGAAIAVAAVFWSLFFWFHPLVALLAVVASPFVASAVGRSLGRQDSYGADREVGEA